MNKIDLVKEVSEKTGLPKRAVEATINSALSSIRDAVAAGEDVGLSRFGKFKAVERKPRTGFNLKTGDKLSIPARKRPAFTPSESFKEAVNK